MERGTKRESRAVHERWRELEHERRDSLHRCSSRLFGGAFLVLAGLTFLPLFLAEDACVHAGPIPHGCMTVIPGPVELVLFLLSPRGCGRHVAGLDIGTGAPPVLELAARDLHVSCLDERSTTVPSGPSAHRSGSPSGTGSPTGPRASS